MKSKIGLVLVLGLLTFRIQTHAQQIAATKVAMPILAAEARSAEQAALPQQTSSDVRVQLGKSLLITSQDALQRVSVTDPTIATAVIVSPTQVLIHGLKAGSQTLVLWDAREQARSFNLIVELDVNALKETIGQMFPGETLQVMQSGGSLVLTGNVSSKIVADRAAALAATMSPSVVNLVQITQGRQVVLLQVKFAEVDRTALQQIGMTLFSTGATNTIGVIGTHQFETPAANVGAIPNNVNPGSEVKAPDIAAGGIGRKLNPTPAAFGFSDLLNIFLFRPDINLGTVIRALQERNVLQILAEPNVMAMNGTEASFLAGGEYPYPVIQGGANVGAVTIQYKEFGVRLTFKPEIMPDGVIRLKVAPEVSALDYANSLNISGFTIPSLTSRKALTEVELKDGQSFAIAGLIDNRLSEIAQKIPFLGDIPILGTFFKSRAQNKSNTELLVMITPKLVEALSPSQEPALPAFPKPFIDPHQFDGKSGESTARPTKD
jgi:pilus assembly protein CpaC